MKKKLFILNVDNIISLITNSSSELFILREESLETVKEMISEQYPDYLTEYEEPVALRDASSEQIDRYLSYYEDSNYSFYSNSYFRLSKEQQKQAIEDRNIAKAKKYGMEPEDFYENWGKSNFGYYSIKPEALTKVAHQLDPNGTIFLLFSIDENPNWDYQEKLEEIGTRIHMG